jgi:hypothetical protein
VVLNTARAPERLGNLPDNKKAARFGGCLDVLASIRQIERDPPTASELS